MTHGTGPSQDLHKQTLTFGAAVLSQLPRLSKEDLQFYIDRQDKLNILLKAAFERDVDYRSCRPDRARWESVYDRLFKKVPDLSLLKVPERPENVGPLRLVIVANELMHWTSNMPEEGVWAKLRDQWGLQPHKCELPSPNYSSRRPDFGTYAVWVRDDIAPDRENKGKSARQINQEGQYGATLLERLLLGADIYFEKAHHLDGEADTLCTGTWLPDGSVARVKPILSLEWAPAQESQMTSACRQVWK